MQIFASENFKDRRGIAPNVFVNISISVSPENFSPHYQSGFQLNPVRLTFNGTETIALLGPRV